MQALTITQSKETNTAQEFFKAMLYSFEIPTSVNWGSFLEHRKWLLQTINEDFNIERALEEIIIFLKVCNEVGIIEKQKLDLLSSIVNSLVHYHNEGILKKANWGFF